MATVPDGPRYWNGVEHSYIPGDHLNIHDSLPLHTEQVDQVDPITFEVIRHALQNINLEHGKTIEKLAVSPITLETRDFQTVILTEDADFVFFGPHLQYMSGMMDLMVKWTMENRSEDPGIFDGDMFLQNDPWWARRINQMSGCCVQFLSRADSFAGSPMLCIKQTWEAQRLEVFALMRLTSFTTLRVFPR